MRLGLLVLILLGSELLFLPDFPLAAAALTDPSSSDFYRGTWVGVRPSDKGQNRKVYFDESVYELGTEPVDGRTEVGLAAHVYWLDINQDSEFRDVAFVRVSVHANGRAGIRYSSLGPSPGSYPSSISCGANCQRLTISTDDGGQWIDLPWFITFYGESAQGRNAYNRAFVCANGYISLQDEICSGSPRFGHSVPNGVIAPLWRDLDPSRGGSIYKFSGSTAFYIIWDRVPDKSGNPQSFLIEITNQMSGGQNFINFHYGTVTTTGSQAGVEDQFGGRKTLLPSSSDWSGKKWEVRGQGRGPAYIGAFSVEINDRMDSSATVLIDRNALAGMNLQFRAPVQRVEILPAFAKSWLADAETALLVAEAGCLVFELTCPAVGVAALGVGITNFSVGKLEELATNIYNSEAYEILDEATNNNDLARVKIHSRFFNTPTRTVTGSPTIDASFEFQFLWKLHDTPANAIHALDITANAFFGDSSFTPVGDNVSTKASTTVTLTLVPGWELYRTDFNDGGTPDWDTWDDDSASGFDYWGATTTKSMEGLYSAWAAGRNDGVQPGGYDNNAMAVMQRLYPTFASYSDLILQFKIWIALAGSDYLEVQAHDGTSWQTLARFSGAPSISEPRTSGACVINESCGEWFSLRFDLPTTLQGLRFLFRSFSGPVAAGVYVDHVMILGKAALQKDVDILSTSNGGHIIRPTISVDGFDYRAPVRLSLTEGNHILAAGPVSGTFAYTASFDHWFDSSTSPSISISPGDSVPNRYQVFYQLTQLDANRFNDAGNTFNSAREVSYDTQYYGAFDGIDTEDWYSLGATYSPVSVTLDVGHTNFDVELYDRNRNLVLTSAKGLGETETFSFQPAEAGWRMRVYVHPFAPPNPSSLRVYEYGFYLAQGIAPGGGGGCSGTVGGCKKLSPYVSTFNGTGWVLDNNVLPQSSGLTSRPSRDFLDYYMLAEQPASSEVRYSLQLSELGNDLSYLDQLSMITIDHDSGVEFGVTTDGRVLSYRDPVPALSAFSRAGQDILSTLKSRDSDTYLGYSGDYVELHFSAPSTARERKLVITSQGIMCRCETWIQSREESGVWTTLARLYPRANWHTDIVHLGALSFEADVRLRVVLMGSQELDFVGLDYSDQASSTVRWASLNSAFHSEGGDVKSLLTASDDVYSTVLEGQTLTVTFSARQSKTAWRNLVLVVEGFYVSV